MSLYDRPQHYLDIFGFIIQYPELTAYEWGIIIFNIIGFIFLIALFVAIPIVYWFMMKDMAKGKL